MLLTLGLMVTGCKPAAPASERAASRPAVESPAVVLYCSVDEPFAREVLQVFRASGGGPVDLVTDTEAGKTTGLVKRIRLEKDRPRADVFWSSEQSQTVMLGRDGLLAAYDPPAAADIPSEFRDPQHLWTGLALRARVLAYDPTRTNAADVPRTWAELAKPAVAGQLAVANPLFGTSRGHVAAMQAIWGPEPFREYLNALLAGGVKIVDGNSTAVRKLIAGEVAWAMTDSDDVLVAQRRGHNVAMTFPDLGDGGTMLVPNTVALVAGAPHAESARRLIDFLVSAEVEEMLARSESGNYPVRSGLREKLGVTLPPTSRVTPSQIADALPGALAAAQEILLK